MDLSQQLQTQEAPTASDLLALVECGAEAETLTTRVQQLSQRDYLSIRRAIAAVEQALDDYALSWQGAEYWCHGGTFPDELKTQAKVA